MDLEWDWSLDGCCRWINVTFKRREKDCHLPGCKSRRDAMDGGDEKSIFTRAHGEWGFGCSFTWSLTDDDDESWFDLISSEWGFCNYEVREVTIFNPSYSVAACINLWIQWMTTVKRIVDANVLVEAWLPDKMEIHEENMHSTKMNSTEMTVSLEERTKA